MAVAAAALLAAAVTVVEARWTRTFDAPYPAIRATADPASIERGRYLAYGPATCAYCHVPKSDWPALDLGELAPLTGAHEFPPPFGTFYSSNLTPDRTTGIGPAFGRGARADAAPRCARRRTRADAPDGISGDER